MTTKSFIKTIGEKGLLADYNTEGKKLQTELTFDSAPKAGSNNPVTSDGIYKSMYSLSNPATPPSFTKDGESYSFICRTNVRAWTRAAFEGYAFPVDWPTFDMIRIRSIVYADPPTNSAIVSITCGKQIYEKFNFVQAVYNGYCYIFANNPFRPLYINPSKYINSDMNSSSMTQDIFQTLTLTKITPSIDDVILEDTPKNNSTNPITSGGVKTAIDKLQSKLTFDSAPTAGSSNPVTSNGIRTMQPLLHRFDNETSSRLIIWGKANSGGYITDIVRKFGLQYGVMTDFLFANTVHKDNTTSVRINILNASSVPTTSIRRLKASIFKDSSENSYFALWLDGSISQSVASFYADYYPDVSEKITVVRHFTVFNPSEYTLVRDLTIKYIPFALPPQSAGVLTSDGSSNSWLTPPASGTAVLKSVNGVIQWVTE